jgi:hypothetical protein
MGKFIDQTEDEVACSADIIDHPDDAMRIMEVSFKSWCPNDSSIICWISEITQGKMNARDSKKSFHRVHDTAIMVVEAVLRVISEPPLLDVEPTRCGRIFSAAR